jgi:hypothetical protein
MMQLSRAFRDSEAMKQVPKSASVLQSLSVDIGFLALFKLSPNVRESIQGSSLKKVSLLASTAV